MQIQIDCQQRRPNKITSTNTGNYRLMQIKHDPNPFISCIFFLLVVLTIEWINKIMILTH